MMSSDVHFDPRTYPPPQHLLWELTLRCNCRCTHCAAAGRRGKQEEMGTAEALAVCEQIAELGAGSVCFMGGEALLRSDWDRIALRLRELEVDTLGLVTNGIALDETAWRKLEILGFCQLVISLDGASAEVHDRRRRRPGALAGAQRAIREMAARPLPFRTVVTSVDKTNFADLPAIRDWLAREAPGITWTINYASPAPGGRMRPEDQVDTSDVIALTRFIAAARAELRGRLDVTASHSLGYFSRRFPDLHDFVWEGCQAGISTLGLRSDGAVTGCLILPDPFIEGNVNERSLSEIWQDPGAFTYNRRFTPDLLRGACRGCQWGERCRGGCRDVAYAFTGDAFEMPFCLYRLEREGRLDPEDDPD